MSDAPQRTWIINALIFDGENEDLQPGSILVLGKTIEQVVHDNNSRTAEILETDQLIDAGGHVVTPGFIDVHIHSMVSDTIQVITTRTDYLMGIKAKQTLEGYLQRGFTTVRDAGGADGSIARAVDEGLIDGPRVYPCGRFISQTGGHGDFISTGHEEVEGGACKCHLLRQCYGMSFVADGADQVLHSARENLKNGASQLKICASGGVASQHDPIFTVQYTPAEVRAAVKAAENWDTYVMAHAYNDASVRMCVENGVKSVEHASLISEETAKLCAEKGVVVCTQYVVYWLTKMNGGKSLSPSSLEKLLAMESKMKNIGKYIRKYDLLCGFGTDIVGPGHEYQNKEFTLRKEDGFSDLQIMRQATVQGGKIVGMCGKLNPYGKVGVIQPGAMADILIHDQNPLEDVSVMEQHEKQLLLIMRDGKVFKNIMQ